MPSTSFEIFAQTLIGDTDLTKTPGDYHQWPIKWVEDSETVAIGAYQGIQFGAAEVREDGSNGKSRGQIVKQSVDMTRLIRAVLVIAAKLSKYV